MPANLENSAVATGLESLIFIPIPKKNNVKEYSNYHKIEFISHVSKVMLKILQSRLEGATVRTGHGTTDWFQIGKGVLQGCVLSP